MTVTATTESQTDARCYLAELLTRDARVIVGDEERQVRLVGPEYDLFKGNYGMMNAGEATVFEATFWDAEHGLTNGTSIRLEAAMGDSPQILHILEGTVTEAKDRKVFVRGRNYFDAEI